MTYDQQHPITPPPELIRQWQEESLDDPSESCLQAIVNRAAQWGADQELEACCEWLKSEGWDGCGYEYEALFEARRPKPPTLKEQALEALEDAGRKLPILVGFSDQYGVIRRALEALPDDL